MIRRNPVTVIHWDIDVIIEYRIHDTQTTELNNHSFVSSLSWQHKLLVDFVPTSPPSYFFFISIHSITTVISFVWFRIQVTHHQGYIDCTLYLPLLWVMIQYCVGERNKSIVHLRNLWMKIRRKQQNWELEMCEIMPFYWNSFWYLFRIPLQIVHIIM